MKELEKIETDSGQRFIVAFNQCIKNRELRLALRSLKWLVKDKEAVYRVNRTLMDRHGTNILTFLAQGMAKLVNIKIDHRRSTRTKQLSVEAIDKIKREFRDTMRIIVSLPGISELAYDECLNHEAMKRLTEEDLQAPIANIAPWIYLTSKAIASITSSKWDSSSKLRAIQTGNENMGLLMHKKKPEEGEEGSDSGITIINYGDGPSQINVNTDG